MHRGTSPWLTGLPLLVIGIGVEIAFSVMDNAAVSTVPIDKSGSVTGMFNTMRIANESLAVASAAAVLTTLIAAQTSTTRAAAAVQGQPATPDVVDAFTGALHVIFVALGLAPFIGALFTSLALRVPKTAEGGFSRQAILTAPKCRSGKD